MDASSIESIVRTLNEHQVHYLIVGGLAVVAHGYVRFTADVDLILAFDETNLTRAVTALTALDYKPRAPVAFSQFIDPAKRREWQEQKGMTVFSLFSPKHPATEIDLFVESPLDFPAAMARAKQIEVAPGVRAVFCSIQDLIALKAAARRPRDLEDIAQLRRLETEEGE
jgi:predicted nucleotidyltransferase